MTPGQAAWARATLSLSLLSQTPSTLKGLTLRARAGPVRSTFLAALHHLPGPLRKIHPAMSRDTLLGGVDLSQTLSAGRLIETPGLLNQPGTLLLTMAERCPPDAAALIAQALDTQPDLTVILFDEGATAEEAAPPCLKERLAFHVSLDAIGRLEATPPSPPAHSANGPISSTKQGLSTLTSLAARLGIQTLRAPLLALRTAEAHAKAHSREKLNEDDLRVATELVLAPRATQLPETEGDAPDAAPENQPETPRDPSPSAPDDMLVEAARAVLPRDVLETLSSNGTGPAKGAGAGQKQKGNRKGRPLPPRPGRLGTAARLDLVATLRTAAPWQKLRGKPAGGPLRILPSDIHLKRFEEQSDRLIIFTVDASGSSALARLAEAKGAVELMLARAYAKRDHVALIAFRGDAAELLLPPTRSLVQAKRRLSALPGGGGTPLADGLRTAGELALNARGKGLSPAIALLTDGRGNIALDGSANRQLAETDARTMARWLLSSGMDSVVLDTAARPQPSLAALTREMAGTYIPLPRADAYRMSAALETALSDGLGP